MKDLKELISGYQDFIASDFKDYKESYATLASEGQKPEVMFIGCSDSRVNPDLIFGSGPGQMFVVRNVANLVPPYEEQGEYHGTSAALEFAVTELKVKHIVVMGHAKCGGIQACIHNAKEGPIGRPFVDSWVQIAREAAERVLGRLGGDADPAVVQRETEFEAIKTSLGNLMTFPFVKEAVTKNELRLHGAHFDISNAEIFALDKQSGQFEKIASQQEAAA